LFVPAHESERVAAGLTSGADAVVADLEDAVPEERKREARQALAGGFSALTGARLVVRINAVDSEHLDSDLELVASLSVDAIVVPKATSSAISVLGPEGPPILAMVESAAGVRESFEIACCGRVRALVLGAMDLSRELGLEPRADSLELLYARSKIVTDSVAAGIARPFDRVYPRLDDVNGLETDARLARSLGFAGKACTDVRQPIVVNRVFG
jgi:citrate lyase subunit beta/citryl-CoA lyase